jgi:hypothetical protein
MKEILLEPLEITSFVWLEEVSAVTSLLSNRAMMGV